MNSLRTFKAKTVKGEIVVVLMAKKINSLLMFRLIIIAIISFVLSGCAVRSVYVPTSQNVLLMIKQIQANGYIEVIT